MSLKRKAEEPLLQSRSKVAKPFDVTKKLLGLLRSFAKTDRIMVELRQLGLRALRTGVVRSIQDFWQAQPEETIASIYEHLIKRASIDAIKVMFAGFLNHSILITVVESMAREAQTVILALPIYRLPVARLCHGVVALTRSKNKPSKFMDRPPLKDKGLVKICLLDSKFTGPHASVCGKVILKLIRHHHETEERLFQEIESNYLALTLNALNLSVSFNDYLVTHYRKDWTKLFMDYAGHTLQSPEFHMMVCAPGKYAIHVANTWLSVAAQACMAIYAFHTYTGRSHSDLNWGNIVVSKWTRVMGKRLVYAFPSESTIDTSPKALVRYPDEFTLKKDSSESVTALVVENPDVRVRIIDWGLSSAFEEINLVQLTREDSDDVDFIAGYAQWLVDHPLGSAREDTVGIFASWWDEAESAGRFILSAMQAYEKKHKATVLYHNLDNRLYDYYSLLVPLFLWWKQQEEQFSEPIASLFCSWVTAFIGRLALPWLTSNVPLTDNDMKESLNDAFRSGLFGALFGTSSVVFPAWKAAYRLGASVHNRDKNAYIVMLRENNDELYQEIVQQRDKIVRLSRKEI